MASDSQGAIAPEMVGIHGLGRSRYGLTRRAADAQRAARLMLCVCAVHAVMLGVIVPVQVCVEPKDKEAPGRHREVGSEGRVARGPSRPRSGV